MLTGLLIFLLVVIALLAIPLEFVFRVEWPDGAENEVALRWAFGLVRARIPSEGLGQAPASDKAPPVLAKNPSARKARG